MKSHERRKQIRVRRRALVWAGKTQQPVRSSTRRSPIHPTAVELRAEAASQGQESERTRTGSREDQGPEQKIQGPEQKIQGPEQRGPGTGAEDPGTGAEDPGTGAARTRDRSIKVGVQTPPDDFPPRPPASSAPAARGARPPLAMTPGSLLTMLTVVAVATGAAAAGEENELDYGYWNYREGADRVNVATVRSVTRVLDSWGKRIFSEIRTLLHSQPSTLLPDYSRVRPLSESVSDLFREVSLLHRRIAELNQRLASLQPVLHRFGFQGAPGGPGGMVGEGRFGPPRGNRVVRRRLVRILRNGQLKPLRE